MKYKKPIRTIHQHKTGKMNKTEKRYADLLALAVRAGEIERWNFERLKVRLADNTFFTPDFYVVYNDHIEIHEIKGGYIHEDAIVKFKMAAELFPEFKWKMIQQKTKLSPWILISEK